MTDSEDLFAVTTRSKLRGPWFFPQMMIASLRIRRQLRRDTQVVRWASIVAGPSEFWTISVWKTRHDMQEFMRSGAHDEIMWLFSKWLRSFWLMRWRPGPDERGMWKGMHMAQEEAMFANGSSNGGGAKRDVLLEKALEHLPKLKQAMGADGTVNYDTTVFARRRRAEVGGAGGAIVHIHTDPLKTPQALLDLRALRQECEADDAMLRAVVGISRPGDVYLLSVWRDREGVNRLLTSPNCRDLEKKWPGFWSNEWLPENEFGHWDGLRLRRARTRYAINVPQAALDAAEPVAKGEFALGRKVPRPGHVRHPGL
ncbi:MAG: hypothetical protein AB1673_03565 [Actinomycetota bacterium]